VLVLGRTVPDKMALDKRVLVPGKKVLDKMVVDKTAGTAAADRIVVVGSRRSPSCTWVGRWTLGRKAPGRRVVDKREQGPDKRVPGKKAVGSLAQVLGK